MIKLFIYIIAFEFFGVIVAKIIFKVSRHKNQIHVNFLKIFSFMPIKFLENFTI